MIRKLILTAALAGSASVAHAADAIVQEVAPPSPPEVAMQADWSGAYLGIHGGYNHFTDDFADPPASLSGSADGSGGLAGVHAGYNFQTGNFLLGVEADISWIDGSGSGVTSTATDVFGRAEANWEASLRARAGIVNGAWLLYATGGLAYADFDFDYTCCGSGFGFGDQFSETVQGYTVGGGVEYAATPDWTVRVEYRYSEFEEAQGSIANCCAPAPNRQEHDLDMHSIRFGLTRKF